MSEKRIKKYEDPTGRAIAVFDSHAAAMQACDALVDDGVDSTDVFILHGEIDAARLDESPKWFADTDESLKRLKRDLESGHTLVSVGVGDSESLDVIREVFSQAGALQMTHFGAWITKSQDLESEE